MSQPRKTTELRMPKRPSFIDIFGYVSGRLVDAIALSSVGPYLPEMVRLMGAKKDMVAVLVGLISISFNVGCLLTTKKWMQVAMATSFKRTMMLCSALVIMSHILLGFSTNVYLASFARFLAGAASGNAALGRTTADALIVNRKFYYLNPATFFIGALLGPVMSSLTANPMGRKSPDDATDNILSRFPMLSSNLILLAPYVAITLITFFFMKDVKNKEKVGDRGTDAGYAMVNFVRRLFRSEPIVNPCPYEPKPSTDAESANRASERTPLLGPASNLPQQAPASEAAPVVEPKLSATSKQILIINTVQGFQSVGFSMMMAYFLTKMRPSSEELTDGFWRLSFDGGYGMSTNRIGFFYTINSIGSFVTYLYIYGALTSRFDNAKLIRWITYAAPITTFLIPLGVYLAPGWKPFLVVAILWLFHTGQDLFTFTLLHSMAVLADKDENSARINVLTMNWTNFGRIVGPLFNGLLFIFGDRIHMSALPFFVSAALGIVSIVVALRLDPEIVNEPKVEPPQEEDSEEDSEEV